jgi:hypothetical protein
VAYLALKVFCQTFVELMMTDPRFWRDLKVEFRELRQQFTAGGEPLAASPELNGEWALMGGPTDPATQRSLENQFRSLATRGGIATGAKPEGAFSAWLNLLRQRSPHFCSVTLEERRDVPRQRRDVAVTQIDLPSSTDRLFIEEHEHPVIVVEPMGNDRYVVVAGHQAYADAIANGLPSVSCQISESSELVDLTSGWFDDVCLASAELCVELETEAFARQQQANDVPALAKEERGKESQHEVTLEQKSQAIPTVTPSGNVFRLMPDGVKWEIQYGGQKVQLPPVKGFELIRRLLENPGIRIPAVVLMERNAGSGGAAGPDGGAHAAVSASAGSPVIDSRTRREVEENLRNIQDQIEIAQDVGNHARASELREKASELRDYLGASTGLGGRTRLIGSDLERSRKAADRRYTTALKHIKKTLPALHHHLSTSISGGNRYVYEPGETISWHTSTP